MGELQEFVHKAQKFLQSSGGNYGQREGYYGQRDSGGYNQGGNGGGNYGQRGWQGQQGGGYGQPWPPSGDQGQMPPGMYLDPRLFM